MPRMKRTGPTASLIRRALDGERVPLARAISLVENEAPEAIDILDACFAASGRAFRIGITGPPGAGKSTLVTRMAQDYRRRGESVAIVAVDPTSPFSGGALLGDRVRMGELSGDPGVFRSEAIDILDACFAASGRAFRIGITGPPGAGKSTLVTRMAQDYRRRGESVAIVAVDPTSPFSGGALLGDRVRMGELSGDPGVF